MLGLLLAAGGRHVIHQIRIPPPGSFSTVLGPRDRFGRELDLRGNGLRLFLLPRRSRHDGTVSHPRMNLNPSHRVRPSNHSVCVTVIFRDGDSKNSKGSGNGTDPKRAARPRWPARDVPHEPAPTGSRIFDPAEIGAPILDIHCLETIGSARSAANNSESRQTPRHSESHVGQS